MYASVVEMRASLLQKRSCTNSPIYSTRQQLTQTHCICEQESIIHRKEIQQHRKEGTRHTYWSQKVSSLLLHKRDEYNHRSQTVSCKAQERCSNTVTNTTGNPSQNTPIQSQNNIKTWPRSLHSRLALQTKPLRKQR